MFEIYSMLLAHKIFLVHKLINYASMAERRKLCWNPTGKMLEHLKIKVNNSNTQCERLDGKMLTNNCRYGLI